MNAARHFMSDALGHIASRLSEGCIGMEEELSDLSERLRVALFLDNQDVVASIMFFQFVLRHFPGLCPRAAVIASHSVGIKLVTEGFHASDIVTQGIDELQVSQIRILENEILKYYDFSHMQERQINFRNAILRVGLETSSHNMYNLENYASSPDAIRSHAMHVVVVDDDAFVRSCHSRMINSILPNADVHGFLCVTDAMDYMTANVESNRVDLVLLDLLMPCQSEQDVGEGGMRVAELLVQQERTLKPTFCARPLTVLVSSSASEKPLDTNGCYGFCDAVVQKPLTKSVLSMLLQAACA
jgi:CheY-like chemotaxis protein